MKYMIEIREHDGTFYATCEQAPGFLLCGADSNALEADILPAMKKLLSVKEQYQKKKGASKADRLVARRELAIAA